MSDIPFNKFVRIPFVVEATLITEENIEEIAKMIGELRVKKGQRYIALDRRIVPSVSRAYVGWYLTRLDDNLRCFDPNVFLEQFMGMPETNNVTFSFLGEDNDEVHVSA